VFFYSPQRRGVLGITAKSHRFGTILSRARTHASAESPKSSEREENIPESQASAFSVPEAAAEAYEPELELDELPEEPELDELPEEPELDELLLEEPELALELEEPELPLAATWVRGWTTAPMPSAKAVAVRRRPASAFPGVASAVVRPWINPGA